MTTEPLPVTPGTELATPGGPVLLMTGTFAVYQEPAGGIHLAWRPVGADEDIHARLPANLVKLAQTIGPEGNPLALFKAMNPLRRKGK